MDGRCKSRSSAARALGCELRDRVGVFGTCKPARGDDLRGADGWGCMSGVGSHQGPQAGHVLAQEAEAPEGRQGRDGHRGRAQLCGVPAQGGGFLSARAVGDRQQGGHGHHQPVPSRAHGVGATRALPLPTGALETAEALLNPVPSRCRESPPSGPAVCPSTAPRVGGTGNGSRQSGRSRPVPPAC